MMLALSSLATSARWPSALSTAPWSRSAFQRSSASPTSRSTSGSGVRMPPSAPAVSGESSVSVKLFWPTTLIAPSSIFATRSRCDSTSRAFMYATASTAPPPTLPPPPAGRPDQSGFHAPTRLDRAAMLLHCAHLLAGALGELVDEGLHHLGALEDVPVVEQVGLVRQDLLDPQAPLLVPG